MNPILCGIATGIIVYLFVYVENKSNKKNQHIPESASFKIPLLTAVLAWVFCSLCQHTTTMPPISTKPWQ